MGIKHILMFLMVASPCWVFSALIRLNVIKSVNISVWSLAALQTLPLVFWLVYVSIIPSVIGQIRSAISTGKEKPEETLSIGVTTRAAFLAISIAGVALVGLQIIEKTNGFISLYYLSIGFFILSFIAFTVSTDISDSAKNIPFRVSSDGVILTRRGARFYQYGLTYLLCGFASITIIIGEIFGFMFIFLLSFMYIISNLPTQKIKYSIRKNIIIMFISTWVIILPIFFLNPNMFFGFWQSIFFICYITLLFVLMVIIIGKYKWKRS